MTSVQDMMVPFEDYTLVSASASLADAVRAVARAMVAPTVDAARPRDRGVLVRSDDGQVIGKLSMWALLAALEPNFEPPIDPFGTVDDKVLWSNWLGPDLADKARAIKVADLLKDKTARYETIDERAPLDLAVHRLVRGNHLSLLVTRSEKIIGILRLSDVFKAIGDLVEGRRAATPA